MTLLFHINLQLTLICSALVLANTGVLLALYMLQTLTEERINKTIPYVTLLIIVLLFLACVVLDNFN